MTARLAYDAIVIGGGHNGLVTAAYLARARRRVCVLERRAVLGGAATTETLWPGYRVSTAAYVVSLLLPDIIRELRLPSYGFQVLPRSPSSFTPLPDGRSLLMGPEPGLNQREIARFSRRDAECYPRYEALLDRVARALEPALSRPTCCRCPAPGGGAGWRSDCATAERPGACTARWRRSKTICPRGSNCSRAPRGPYSIGGSSRTY